MVVENLPMILRQIVIAGTCMFALPTFAEPFDVISMVDRLPEQSVAGHFIAARTVDSFMTPLAEKSVLQRLHQPWGKPIRCITLQHLQRYLNESIPTAIDVIGLDDLGLTTDMPINYEGQASELRGQTLQRCLPKLELTWVLKSNRLLITTRDAAESDLVIRIYDVTPLTRYDFRGSPNSSHFDFDMLDELIVTTIEPNTWEDLGGPSTTGMFVRNGRGFMVFGTTTPVHLQIESMLNQLNRMSGEGSLSRTVTASPNDRSFRNGRIRRSTSRLPKFGINR